MIFFFYYLLFIADKIYVLAKEVPPPNYDVMENVSVDLKQVEISEDVIEDMTTDNNPIFRQNVEDSTTTTKAETSLEQEKSNESDYEEGFSVVKAGPSLEQELSGGNIETGGTNNMETRRKCRSPQNPINDTYYILNMNISKEALNTRISMSSDYTVSSDATNINHRENTSDGNIPMKIIKDIRHPTLTLETKAFSEHSGVSIKHSSNASSINYTMRREFEDHTNQTNSFNGTERRDPAYLNLLFVKLNITNSTTRYLFGSPHSTNVLNETSDSSSTEASNLLGFSLPQLEPQTDNFLVLQPETFFPSNRKPRRTTMLTTNLVLETNDSTSSTARTTLTVMIKRQTYKNKSHTKLKKSTVKAHSAQHPSKSMKTHQSLRQKSINVHKSLRHKSMKTHQSLRHKSMKTHHSHQYHQHKHSRGSTEADIQSGVEYESESKPIDIKSEYSENNYGSSEKYFKSSEKYFQSSEKYFSDYY